MDSVFDRFLATPFPDDQPLIPVAEIERSLDAIETASVDRQMTILREQTASVLRQAIPFIQRRDMAGIAGLTWNAGVTLQLPIVSTWAFGWYLGSVHMIQEMRIAAGIDRNSGLQQFATPEELAAIEALITLQPGQITNTAAEQAVLRRSLQLAGNFSDDQLARLKFDLIATITPDAEGKTLSRQQLEERIQQNLAVGKVRAEAIARTELTNAYNTSRVQTALQSSLVTHFRFLAITDARTSPICRSRNGMLISAQDQMAIAMNKPPLHVRCRSTLSIVMATINPTHAEWVNDPNRDWQQRTLEPLPSGWRTAETPRQAGTAVSGMAPGDRTQQIARSGGAHDAYLAAGKTTVGARANVLDKVITGTPKLNRLQAEFKVVDAEFDRLLDANGADFTAAFQSDTGKRFKDLQTAIAAEQAKVEAKAVQTMRDLRSDLLATSSLSAEDAQALAAQVKINKTATKELSEAQIRAEIAEFYQLTGGKGSSTLNKIILDEERAYALGNVVNIGRHGGDAKLARQTLWHEVAHHAESESDALIKASDDWVKARATGDRRSLNDLIPGANYGQTETAFPDTFTHPYVGKLYGDGSEVLSVAMESFTSAEAMLELYKRDPEHFRLALGMIR